MSFSFRRSKKMGPFRFNFSSRGIGVSLGVKGARIGTGPSGTYVSLSKGGFYYRKKIGSKRKKNRTRSPKFTNSSSLVNTNQNQNISTGNIDNISDIDSADFINELAHKHRKWNLHKWLGLLPLFLFVGYYFSNQTPAQEFETIHSDHFIVNSAGANVRVAPSTKSEILTEAKRGDSFQLLEFGDHWSKIQYGTNQPAYINNSTGRIENKTEKVEIITQQQDLKLSATLHPAILVLLSGWTVFLFFQDKKRKRVSLIYNMDDEFKSLYNKHIQLFNEIFDVKTVWQYTNKQKISNSKYTAGANALVNRIKIRGAFTNGLPTPLIESNVKIPHISLKDIDFFFLPEKLLLRRGSKFASVFYKNISIDIRSPRFIEDQKVPSDANIIDYTWKYVNKRGGPDRRFSGNYQIPVCEYTEYHFNCLNGINEVIITSKRNGFDNFVKFLQSIGQLQNYYSNKVSNKHANDWR